GSPGPSDPLSLGRLPPGPALRAGVGGTLPAALGSLQPWLTRRQGRGGDGGEAGARPAPGGTRLAFASACSPQGERGPVIGLGGGVSGALEKRFLIFAPWGPGSQGGASPLILPPGRAGPCTRVVPLCSSLEDPAVTPSLLFSRSSFQQRLSHTTLSDLALVLIDGTVFEIVQGLLEIQHLTEKSLYNQRLKLQSEHRVLKQTLLNKHKEAQQACRPHNLPILRAAQQREQEAMEHRIREEQRMMDEKIVLELDQKVVDQQSTLEKAGVTGFYVTTNPQELTLQMNLLELIRKLQQRGYQPGKPFP
uniref:Protein DGCR6 n=1 Tax=Sarcophilus harrisii TaxID=9305 RepID=A0A7N4PWI9_SARHA